MAAVYKAYQPAMDRYVAIKVLPRHLANDPKFAARFQREARIVAKLLHPNILQVFDYGQAEGHSYIVMPLVPGGTLKDLLAGKVLPFPTVLRIVAQIAAALDFAHVRKIVHRDVKPSNILIDESDNCLLTDFGLARMIEPVHQITATGVGIGTPDYMSPEQGLGERLDRRTDIYSLAVVLYELLTGRVPYRAETPMAVILKHIHDPLPLPRSVNPQIPEAVERVVLKAMAKAPRDRYQTAGDLAGALLAADGGITEEQLVPVAMMQSRPARLAILGRLRRSHERLIRRWALITAIVVILVGLTLVSRSLLGARFFGERVETPASSVQGSESSQVEEMAQQTPLAATLPRDINLQQYDGFDDASFDSGFNPALWQLYSDDDSALYQENGMLVIRQSGRPRQGTALAVRRYFDFTPTSSFAFEAKLMLDPDQHPISQAESGAVSVMLEARTPEDELWIASCQLIGDDKDRAGIRCLDWWNDGEDGTEIMDEGRVSFGTWHTFRIEFDPGALTCGYQIDGYTVGSFSPVNGEKLRDATFRLTVGTWTNSSDTIIGYVDDVRFSTSEVASEPGTVAKPTIGSTSESQDRSLPSLLFDEAHAEQDVLDLDAARRLLPENPKFAYLGSFQSAIEGLYLLQRHASGKLDRASLEDVSILLLASPTWPLTLNEIQSIATFVSTGGGLIVWHDGGPSYPPNNLLRTFDIQIEGTTLEASEDYLWDSVSFWATDVGDHPVTNDSPGLLVNSGTSLELGDAATSLVMTGPSVWRDVKRDGLHQSSEEAGPFVVVASAQFGDGRVVVFADNSFTNTFMDNRALIMNALRWVAGPGSR